MAMNAASAVLRSRILAASALVACVTVAGCYSTSGGFLPHTDGGFTYESTQMRPTTISVLNICDRGRDLRGTGEEPVGLPKKWQ